MGYDDWSAFRNDLEQHRLAIAAQFELVAFREQSGETPFRKQVEQAWEAGSDAASWTSLLEHGEVAEAPAVAE